MYAVSIYDRIFHNITGNQLMRNGILIIPQSTILSLARTHPLTLSSNTTFEVLSSSFFIDPHALAQATNLEDALGSDTTALNSSDAFDL